MAKKPQKTQKKIDPEWEPNQERYRACCEPHATPELASEALSEFFKGVSGLREKYRIRDVYVIGNIAMIGEDGEETIATTNTQMGTQSLMLAMVASAFGMEKQKHEQMIQKMIS